MPSCLLLCYRREECSGTLSTIKIWRCTLACKYAGRDECQGTLFPQYLSKIWERISVGVHYCLLVARRGVQGCLNCLGYILLKCTTFVSIYYCQLTHITDHASECCFTVFIMKAFQCKILGILSNIHTMIMCVYCISYDYINMIIINYAVYNIIGSCYKPD